MLLVLIKAYRAPSILVSVNNNVKLAREIFSFIIAFNNVSHIPSFGREII